MDVVTGATSSLLPKLTALLQDEYNLQKKVKKDIESTQKELIFMRAALCKVAEVPPERLDHQVKAWASNVKELSYDMEDAVDNYDVCVLVGGTHVDSGNTFINSMVEMLDIKKGRARHHLGSVIEELMGLTRQLAELRDRYKLDDLSIEPVPTALTQAIPVSRNYPLWTWWRQYAKTSTSDLKGWLQQIHFKIFDTIGNQLPMEQTKQQLFKTWLLTNNSGTDVCWIIVGTTGDVVAKQTTTFPTELCWKLCGHFDQCYRVTVSQNTDNPKIIELKQSSSSDDHDDPQTSNNNAADDGATKKTTKFNIFKAGGSRAGPRNSTDTAQKQAPQSPSRDDQEKKIKNLLEDKLEKNSCLLLIEDLRCKEMWEKVLGLLPDRNKTKRCRIIVTTSFQEVATACGQGGAQIYNMNDLVGKSKDIFESALSESKLIKSGCKDGDKISMRDIPPRLWKMCGEDLPLAVVMLAGLVSCNRDMSADGWEKVCTKLVPRKILTQDGVRTILSHCYNDMPAEIKTCCLYLSMYPRGHKISRKHLTRRWIAEGFVTKKQGQSEEDVAEDYFDNLIKRKFIQPVEPSINLKVKNCQVYDLVHEFVVSKAREENFVTVVGGYWTMVPPNGRVRRLSLKPSPEEGQQKATKGMDLSHVRSLTVSSTQQCHLDELLRQSRIVQVLGLDGCKKLDNRAMKEIYGMLLLRYLSLRRTNITELHKDIGKLKNLEVLDVRETEVTVLPYEVCQLQRLSKIFGGDKKKMMALKLSKKMKPEKMKSLRVLSGVEITIDSESAAKALGHLTNLRKLAIYKLVITKGKNHLLSSIRSLCHGRYLQTLVIEVDKSCFQEPLTALELSSQIANFPPWTVLTKLRLPVTALCKEAHEVLKALCELSTLSSLTLYDKRYTEREAYESTNGENSEVQEQTNAAEAIQSEKVTSNGEIFVKSSGFENLKLLRFFGPLLPRLSFDYQAMPKLETLELRFHNFDGIYGIENLEALQVVCFRVHEQADKFTKAILDEIEAANTTDDRGIRIMRDTY